MHSEQEQRVIKDALLELEFEIGHLEARLSERIQFETSYVGGGVGGGGGAPGLFPPEDSTQRDAEMPPASRGAYPGRAQRMYDRTRRNSPSAERHVR